MLLKNNFYDPNKRKQNIFFPYLKTYPIQQKSFSIFLVINEAGRGNKEFVQKIGQLII